MSEATPEGGNTSGETPAADEFKAITSQDDLNKVINERLTRERAKFADYKDLKVKAEKLDTIEQANQTEAEKTAERLADLEAELNNTRRDSLRLKIASANGITDADDIDLFLTGTDEETLTKQAKRLAERTADRKKNGNHVPREGTNPKAGDDPMRSFARGLFDRAKAE
jgi:hypothetical protein